MARPVRVDPEPHGEPHEHRIKPLDPAHRIGCRMVGDYHPLQRPNTVRTPETGNASQAFTLIGKPPDEKCPMRTEHPSPRYSAIDLWNPAEILDAMIEGQ